MFDLKGKKALVTGSTQGIGFEIAKTFALKGATVFVNGASSSAKCKEASEKIPGSIPVHADLSSDEGIESLYNITKDVDILVLNASYQHKAKWDMTTEENLNRTMSLNFESPLKLIKKYSPSMKKKGYGRILAIGSVNQHQTHKMLSAYSASKCALASLIRNIAKDLAPFGITVNILSPGAIETPRNEADLSDDKFKAEVIASIPCGRIGTPSDISPAALLLCSDEGAYITGSDLIIDGGMCL